MKIVHPANIRMISTLGEPIKRGDNTIFDYKTSGPELHLKQKVRQKVPRMFAVNINGERFVIELGRGTKFTVWVSNKTSTPVKRRPTKEDFQKCVEEFLYHKDTSEMFSQNLERIERALGFKAKK